MSLDFDEVNNAFDQTERTIRLATQCAARAVRFSAGRLRTLGLDQQTLVLLKRELQHYDAKRGRWRAA